MAEHRFLRALRRQPVDCTPVWIMRQAGRYLPEYRATRARAGSFVKLCKTPELACEVTLQPIARYPLDAAILFSDILTIPDAMGLGLSVEDGVGPRLAHPLRTRAPLIGFAGSPWTLACYMIEGEGGASFARAKALAWDEPATMHRLLEVVARAVAAYLAAQAAAGAQALMVFDTWGGLLAPAMFREFSLRYLAQIARSIQSHNVASRVPLILFSKGANAHLEALADTGCAALGLDWTISLGAARARVGARVALQGNLDPAVLHARPETIRAEVQAALADFGPHPGHVFNLGHGITPDVDPDRLAVLIDAVHESSATATVRAPS